ncbi:MAG: molybdenum cofactor guanylyltransferase [Lachnospiraceae bacterium]|nr:molybdenum cofactor guanylyltransferase [Lachnospiraceae bacterium]
MNSLAILLLAGGYSRRMGQNKANLTMEGQTFAEKIAAELSSCGPVYLSVSADISPDFKANTEKYPRIVDEIPHIGPLGGISAAMHQTDAEAYFVCACDMPRMNAAFVRHLIQIWEQNNTDSSPHSGSVLSSGRSSDIPHQPGSLNHLRPEFACQFVSDVSRQRKSTFPDALLVRNRSGRIYTTAGIYHRNILPLIEKQILEKNYRLRDLLTESNVFYLEENSLGELKSCLININTMEEYQKLSE